MLRDNLLTIECEVADGIGFIRMEGELIAESRYEPERILREWLESEVYRVIIHFGQVTHIDSAGLSTLLGALHRYRRHQGDLILAELNPSLSAIFEVTSMQAYFKIFDDVTAARKHFGPLPTPKKARVVAKPKKEAAAKKGGATKIAMKTATKKEDQKPTVKRATKTPVKKTSVKKTSVKKAAAKKSGAKKAAVKKAAVKPVAKSKIVVKKKKKKVAR